MSEFAKVNEGDTYYCINARGTATKVEDTGSELDNTLFYNANYCSSKELIERRGRQETLNRRLWRYACDQGETENKWNGINKHYYIFTEDGKHFSVHWNTVEKSFGTIYFSSEEAARLAIENILGVDEK